MRHATIKPGLFAAIALAAATSPFAAHAETRDNQIWLTANATGSISGDIMANVEVVGRQSFDQDRIYEAEMTAQIGYRLSKAVTIFVGYTRVPGYRGSLPITVENRLREQVNLTLGTVAAGALSARTLLEERTREGADGTHVRLRQQVKWSRPFQPKGATALVLWHESFIGLNSASWGQRSGYSRMRNFVGVSLPVVPKKVKAEIGYLNQYDFRKGVPDAMAHVLSTTLSLSF